MLLQEPTPEMVVRWKETYNAFRPRLTPNNRPIGEVTLYLKNNYPVTELKDQKYLQVVIGNVTLNKQYAEKIPDGTTPIAQVFQMENTGSGKILYENQDELFRGTPIIAGFEQESGYFMVEGSSRLWDELFVYRGLDSVDLDNFYLVAESRRVTKKGRGSVPGAGPVIRGVSLGPHLYQRRDTICNR